MVTILSVLFFWVCILLLLYAFGHSLNEDRAKREMEFPNKINESAREIPAPKKEAFGRCSNAIGRFGFDVSNPIRIKSLRDVCFGKYLYGMFVDGEGVSGYIVVSACWCSLFGNKPIYKVGVRKNDKKSFVTLFFIEDGMTKPEYYPSGILSRHDLYFQNLIKNGGHVSPRDSFFQNGMLLSKENKQKAVPAYKESVYRFEIPKKRDGEDEKQFASRVRDQKTRKMLSDEYWRFINGV